MTSADDLVIGLCALLYWDDFTSQRECLLAINRMVLPPSYIYEIEGGYRAEWSLKTHEMNQATLDVIKRLLNAREVHYLKSVKRISAHPDFVYTSRDLWAAATMNEETIDRVLDPDLIWRRAYRQRHKRYQDVFHELKRRGMSFEAIRIMWDNQRIGERRTKLVEVAPFLEAVLEESATALQHGVSLPWEPHRDGNDFYFYFLSAYAWWNKGVSQARTWDLLAQARFVTPRTRPSVLRQRKLHLHLSEAAEDGVRIPAAFSDGLEVYQAPKEEEGVAKGG